MTNLFIATGIFHPESGGPATYLYHLLPHLQEHGYNVRLLTYGTPNPQLDKQYPYEVIRIPRTPLPLRMAAYAYAAHPLIQWADMIYQHTLMLPLINLPGETHKPCVAKIVGDQTWERAIHKGWVPPVTDIDQFQLSQYNHPMVRLNKNLRRREMQQLNGVIVPSHYLKQMVTRWGVPSMRIKVVYNALPPDHETLTMSQAEARQSLGLHPDRPIILTVARLVPWKGIDDFILAIQDIPDIQLIVAGDGEYLTEFQQFAMEKGVQDRVSFLGRVPRDQIAVYMRAADYVGLYSGYEGLSHVLLESLNMGTPVIASDKGGNPEVVGHHVNGLLVPYNNARALAETLMTAFQPGTRERLAANTQTGLEKFDFDRMVYETIGALESFR